MLARLVSLCQSDAKPTRVCALPLIHRLVSQPFAEVLQRPTHALEQFVEYCLDYANLLDDAHDSQANPVLPAAVEMAFRASLDLSLQAGKPKLVEIVLVNLEIIYKKYDDTGMLQVVGDQIDAYKRHRQIGRIQIAWRTPADDKPTVNKRLVRPAIDDVQPVKQVYRSRQSLAESVHSQATT